MKESRPRGRPRKLPEHQAFSLRLPVELHQELRHYAVDARRSLNDILVDAITQWWAAQPERENVRRSGPRPPFPKRLRPT